MLREQHITSCSLYFCNRWLPVWICEDTWADAARDLTFPVDTRQLQFLSMRPIAIGKTSAIDILPIGKKGRSAAGSRAAFRGDMIRVYSRSFFANRRLGATHSSEALAPLVLAVLSLGGRIDAAASPDSSQPATMLDVGCGDGTWVKKFRELGLEGYGIDGPWSPFRDAILWDFSKRRDLSEIILPRRHFDFILSLEFLEHLDQKNSRQIIEWLCSLTNTVVFSAALPGQGGTHHINEQRVEYWTKQFSDFGFVACDALRPKIWSNSDIAPWYRQNILMFFREKVPVEIEHFAADAWASATRAPLSLFHPDLLEQKRGWRLLRGLKL